MAKIIRRTWAVHEILGEPIKRVAYGYTLMVNGRQERSARPTEEDDRK